MPDRIGLVVPVFKNIIGAIDLIAAVDVPVKPYIIPNYRENIGVSASWNRGIKAAMDDGIQRIVVANDDTTPSVNTISKLVDSLQKYDFITAINTRDYEEVPAVESYDDSPDFSFFVTNPFELTRFAGWFDENFTPAYFEDNDMAYRLKLSGLTQKRRLDAPMFHIGSVTQNWEGIPYVNSEMFETNREYYKQKWGGEPGDEVYTTPFNDPNKSIKDW